MAYLSPVESSLILLLHCAAVFALRSLQRLIAPPAICRTRLLGPVFLWLLGCWRVRLGGGIRGGTGLVAVGRHGIGVD